MPAASAPLGLGSGASAGDAAAPQHKIQVSTVLHGAAHSFWSAFSAAPWLGALLALVIALALVRRARGALHRSHPRDPVRRFDATARRDVLARAGARCEHASLLFGRCRTTTGLHAGHVHPHSGGGATSIDNARALCGRHDRATGARIPSDRQLARLARRRAGYFPPGESGVIERHGHRQDPASAPVTG